MTKQTGGSSFAYLAPTFVGLVSFGLAIALPILAPSPLKLPLIDKTPTPAHDLKEKVLIIIKTSLTHEAESASPASAKLLFVGDIMLARDVERTLKNRGADWPFLKLTPSLQSLAGIVIGNLETTVRDQELLEAENVLSFDTTPNNLAILKNAGFTHLSLANNHTDDFGSTVTANTRSAVINSGLMPFGDPLASPKYLERLELDGLNISLIGFHAFSEYVTDLENVIKTEQAAGQFIIVYPHWGSEYVNKPSSYQQEAAQRFIEAGADLIIGAHPHVIQQYEEIAGVPVIYSLGNFLFDQDFSEETQTGLVAVLAITTHELQIEFLPIRILNRQVVFDASWQEAALQALNLESLILKVPRPTDQTPQAPL